MPIQKNMKSVRLMQLEQYITDREFVSIEEICDKFNIHPNTARSDIKELVARGVAQKRYGGVTYSTANLPISFRERQEKNIQAKRSIGLTASQLLNEDDVIYVDAGTTALMLFLAAKSLPKRLTVITNNLDVVAWAARNTDYTVFVLPGKVNRQLNALASLETIDSLSAYNIKTAFLGTRGVSLKGELSSTSNIDAKLKMTVIALSERVVLMADYQKINQTAMFKFASMSSVDYWACEVNNEEVRGLADKFNTLLV